MKNIPAMAIITLSTLLYHKLYSQKHATWAPPLQNCRVVPDYRWICMINYQVVAGSSDTVMSCFTGKARIVKIDQGPMTIVVLNKKYSICYFPMSASFIHDGDTVLMGQRIGISASKDTVYLREAERGAGYKALKPLYILTKKCLTCKESDTGLY